MANKNTSSTIQLGKILLLIAVVVMLSVTMYFSNVLIKNSQSLNAGAANGNAEIFLEPSVVTIPPDGLVHLWVTTDKQLGFVAIDLTFDPTLIKLAQEITLPTLTLERSLKVTTMAQANTTGKISVVLGIDPTGLETAPTGSFPIANLKFSKNTTISNKVATLSVDPASSQLVDLGAIPFNLTFKNASFTINPVDSPIATPIASVTPTIVPTPTPTKTPVASPITSIKPTSTPVSGNIDFIGPSLTLTSGKNWLSYYVTAKASDKSGVSQIVMTKSGVVVKTCTNKTSCTYKPSSKLARPYDIVVTSTDKSSAHNLSTATVTIK